MEAIRTKDRVFLAVIVPVVLVAAYVYFWRGDAVRRVESIGREVAALVPTEDFPLERTRAERMLAEARAEAEAERKQPPPAQRVRAKPGESVAARERGVLEGLRSVGLTVRTSQDVDENKAGVGGDVLRRTGSIPLPVCRVYTLAGPYGAMLGFLREIDAKERAVLPERVEMVRPGVWALSVWL